ncbi:ChrR family anti-sigma-E factor [Pseudohalocynthiibacter aestuariivivens]|uniref:ChrR family anti-sigma-E factor n=1 Tax=Pseudohalocynthiibacter aestuariivivens TaxID=1591409 RepID=A0ABV5JH91_9RHOB|nr:ChrR family anti-sigma-E factor [Pseudohalocynthiibacter aestuariivivens]MBS9716453.1 cupin domain-containing protein [Pseudohalocynthiibacter aestuariivivens]
MADINHHIPESLLQAYATGSLVHPFALVVAAHISLCTECRAGLEAHNAAGGAILESLPDEPVSDDLKVRILDQLDAPFKQKPVYERSGVYPGPVMEALKGAAPRWRRVGMGVRQSILSAGQDGSVRLLFIPPGQAVPDHSHNGLELTLVLQGSFSDETGRYGVGDLEVANQDLEHTPIADAGAPCICLAATDAPLRFKGLVPRILQPVFRI